MDNLKKHAVLLVSTPERNVLKEELRSLLIKLQNGIVPEKEYITGLVQLFQNYKSETIRLREERAQIESEDSRDGFELNEKDYRIEFTNVLGDKSEDELIEKNRLFVDGNVRFLKRLMLQKLVPKNDGEVSKEFVTYLKKNGIVSLVMIEFKEEKYDYYMLTSKGWSALGRNENMKVIASIDPSFIVPNKIMINPEEWKEKTFLQAAVIHEYYKENRISDYILFPDERDAQRLYGCEIKDSNSVSYCLAACLIAERRENEKTFLYESVQLDQVDELIIVLRSAEEGDRLKRKWPVDAGKLEKIRFYELTRGSNDE